MTGRHLAASSGTANAARRPPPPRGRRPRRRGEGVRVRGSARQADAIVLIGRSGVIHSRLIGEGNACAARRMPSSHVGAVAGRPPHTRASRRIAHDPPGQPRAAVSCRSVKGTPVADRSAGGPAAPPGNLRRLRAHRGELGGGPGRDPPRRLMPGYRIAGAPVTGSAGTWSLLWRRHLAGFGVLIASPSGAHRHLRSVAWNADMRFPRSMAVPRGRRGTAPTLGRQGPHSRWS
jgi:hypothetical protein